jgi:hypothetical protein
MKREYFFLPAFVFVIVSCSQFKHKEINFSSECGNYYPLSVDSPAHTHKCCVTLVQGCAESDSIQIYMDDKAITGFSFYSDSIGYRKCQDWYSGVLGLRVFDLDGQRVEDDSEELKIKIDFYSIAK